MLSRAHLQLNTQAEDRRKKKFSSLSAVERKFFHWENMAYHVCLSSGMGSCRCACKHGDTLAGALEALLRLVRQQVPASVAWLLKKRRLTQKRDTIFNCQTVWIGRKEDLVCAKSIFALTHTVCKACPHVLTSNLFTFCKCTLALSTEIWRAIKKIGVINNKEENPSFLYSCVALFYLFFIYYSDQTEMLRLFSIKVPPPRMLKRWCCCAWQIRNKQHLRRRVEFEWASQNPMQGFFHADEDGGAEGWSLIFYSWGFMALCSSSQDCVCVWERDSYKQYTWG